jgi:AcrR family transcriptional regulator
MTDMIAVQAPWQRPMRADARRNCERLLTAAEVAFADHGTAASLEEIARNAGVGIGTLYRHFPTREQLIQAVLSDRLDQLCALAERLLESACPAEALATWARAYIQAANTYRGLPGSIVEAGGDNGGVPPGPICLRLIEAGGNLLVRAQLVGKARRDVDARDLFTLLSSVAVAAAHVPPDSGRLDRLLAVIAAGLAPEPEVGPPAQRTGDDHVDSVPTAAVRVNGEVRPAIISI